MKFKYLNTSDSTIWGLDCKIQTTILNMQYNNLRSGIVDLHVDKSYGDRIPSIVFGIFYIDNNTEIGSVEETLKFDEILEEMNEELHLLVKAFNLLPEGYDIHTGWYDGSICTYLTTIS